MGRSTENMPSVGEVWQTLGDQLGLQVEVRGEHSVRAEGTVRSRTVTVDIDAQQRGSELLKSFARVQRKSRVHREWRTELTVACANPRGLTGTIESVVDVSDPKWDPRNFDPSHCRVVRTQPPDLAATVLTPDIRDRLMAMISDVRIEVDPGAVCLRHERKAGLDVGVVGSSQLHEYPGPVLLPAEGSLAGPPQWITLLCDLADAVDA